VIFIFFFFQAEDGIRDDLVTGVQTCALPISISNAKLTYQRYRSIFQQDRWLDLAKHGAQTQRVLWASTGTKNPNYSDVIYVEERSEERRVGKECRYRWPEYD